MWQKKTKLQEKARSKKSRKKSPETTDTSRTHRDTKLHYNSLTNTTIKEDTGEYGGYMYMMIIITGLLWAKKKTHHEKQTDVR